MAALPNHSRLPTVRRAGVAGALALALFGAGCSNTPYAPPVGDADYGRLLAETDFPQASELLALGFDPPSDTRNIEAGDCWLFGLKSTDGDDAATFYLRLTALESYRPYGGSLLVENAEFEDGSYYFIRMTSRGAPTDYWSRTIPISLSLYDEQARLVSSDEVNLPADFLARGFREVCTTRWPRRTDEALLDYYDSIATGELQQPFNRGLRTLMSVLQIVQREPRLRELLEDLIAPIDKLRVLMRGLTIAPDFAAAEPIPDGQTAAISPASWRFPVTLAAGDTPLAYVEMEVCDSSSPWSLVGGLRGFRAVRTGNPDVSLRLLALAAHRRGSSAQEQ